MNDRPLQDRDPRIAARSRWFWGWLNCVAFFYPLNWLSRSLLFSLPNLVLAGPSGFHRLYVQLDMLGAFVFVRPEGAVGGTSFFPRGEPLALSIQVIVVLVAAAALLPVKGRGRLLAGVGLAVLADSAPGMNLYYIFSRPGVAGNVVMALVLFGVLCLGLRWIVDAWGPATYWGRVGSLAAGFVVLRLLPWPWLWHFSYARLNRYALALVAPSALAAFVAGTRWPRSSSAPAQSIGWKLAVAGAAASLALTFGVRQAQRTMNCARLAANRVALAAYPKIPPNAPYPRLFFQKGVNFTAEFPDVYASEAARRMLERLPEVGVNAVALVPYGWSRGSPPRVVLNTGPESWESDEGLEGIAQVAHARGLKVMLKPGIWSGTGFAGDIDFRSAEDRARWFDQYRLFLEHYARLATRIHADLFCVGGEFVKLTRYDAEWRKLIARVRELYSGPLVYAANHGEEFESLTFWDALDYIGLQEYYPLPDNLSTEALMEKVEAVQRKFQKPVIFTEAGFPSVERPNRKPWDAFGRKASLEDQARCYEAIYRAFYHQPWFEGMYWWAIGTNGYGGPNDPSHTPWGKPAMEVVKRWYSQEGR